MRLYSQRHNMRVEYQHQTTKRFSVLAACVAPLRAPAGFSFFSGHGTEGSSMCPLFMHLSNFRMGPPGLPLHCSFCLVSFLSHSCSGLASFPPLFGLMIRRGRVGTAFLIFLFPFIGDSCFALLSYYIRALLMPLALVVPLCIGYASAFVGYPNVVRPKTFLPDSVSMVCSPLQHPSGFVLTTTQTALYLSDVLFHPASCLG